MEQKTGDAKDAARRARKARRRHLLAHMTDRGNETILPPPTREAHDGRLRGGGTSLRTLDANCCQRLRLRITPSRACRARADRFQAAPPAPCAR
jgi:hypothetical protein